MTQLSPTRSHSGEAPKRPKGILKNSSSYIGEHPTSPTGSAHPEQLTAVTSEPGSLTDKELTMQNTLQNAGHRRSSSAAARGSLPRRRSSASHNGEDPNNPRLKWDEANLYLTEQEKSATMKINEPKTPYAKHYDPAEDEEEGDDVPVLDAGDLVVDELDRSKMSRHKKQSRDSEIPGLELGEPEEAVPPAPEGSLHRSDSGREKQVTVNPSEDDGSHGEEVGLSREEKEKHRQFEERRKRHYEMKDVKDLLGHPEELEDEMDEEDDAPNPPMPEMPRNLANGSS